MKFRSIFIKIGAKNDEIDEKFEHFLHFSEKSLVVFLQNFEIGAVQKCIRLVGTFGFLFFSLQELPDGPRPPTDPKMPFPYWKIDHFIKELPSISMFHLLIPKKH